jgi:hypothetical protein
MSYITGNRPLSELAVIGNQLRVVPPHIDLKYLTHVNEAIWRTASWIDSVWSAVSYVPLNGLKIEPDNWDLFWEKWNKEQAIIGGVRKEEKPMWRGLIIWLHPAVDHTKFNFNETQVSDWSKDFPKMFEKIKTCMPWSSIEKIVLWQNINEITPHFDPDAVIYPWPDSFRTMLFDSNPRSTFYMCKWPNRNINVENDLPKIKNKTGDRYGVSSNRIPLRDREYVKLNDSTNTFVFNNGSFLHGADMADKKIIMAVKGRPDPARWLNSLLKYKGNK